MNECEKYKKTEEGEGRRNVPQYIQKVKNLAGK